MLLFIMYLYHQIKAALVSTRDY